MQRRSCRGESAEVQVQVQRRRCRGESAEVQVQVHRCGCRCRGAEVQVQRGAGADAEVQRCRDAGAGAEVQVQLQRCKCRCRGAGACTVQFVQCAMYAVCSVCNMQCGWESGGGRGGGWAAGAGGVRGRGAGGAHHGHQPEAFFPAMYLPMYLECIWSEDKYIVYIHNDTMYIQCIPHVGYVQATNVPRYR